MAIDPSLLFLQGQQQSSQGQPRNQNQSKDKQREREVELIQDNEENPEEGTSFRNQETSGAQQQHSKPATLDSRDDATLAAFLARLDEYEPILPDTVTRYYLERAGFQCSDDRV